MRIGTVDIPSQLVLAPMAGVTDLAFRLICRELGAGLTVTEMVSAKALCYQDKKSRGLLKLSDGEHPASAQIFGSDPGCMAEAACIAAELSGADLIDINMGCPVGKIVSNGDGSALMRDPEKAARIEREMEKLRRRRERREERRRQPVAAGDAQPVVAPPREIEVGSKVVLEGQQTPGVVQSLKGDKVQVAFGQLLTTVDRKRLRVVSNSEYREATRPVTARTVVSVDVAARKLNFKDHIDVRGMRASEAVEAVQSFIDDALMVGVGSVTILHGKGAGALKEEIRRYLRTVPDIAGVADEHADRGGAGITVVTFGSE